MPNKKGKIPPQLRPFLFKKGGLKTKKRRTRRKGEPQMAKKSRRANSGGNSNLLKRAGMGAVGGYLAQMLVPQMGDLGRVAGGYLLGGRSVEGAASGYFAPTIASKLGASNATGGQYQAP